MALLRIAMVAMDAEARDELEGTIRARFDAADLDGAATAAVRGYGPQIFGFLMAMHRNAEEAGEVFSAWSEDLWRGLPGFGWASSFRTWAYTVARHASFRYRKDRNRRAQRNVPLSACPAVSEVALEVRSRTLTYLQTESRSK